MAWSNFKSLIWAVMSNPHPLFLQMLRNFARLHEDHRHPILRRRSGQRVRRIQDTSIFSKELCFTVKIRDAKGHALNFPHFTFGDEIETALLKAKHVPHKQILVNNTKFPSARPCLLAPPHPALLAALLQAACSVMNFKSDRWAQHFSTRSAAATWNCCHPASPHPTCTSSWASLPR